MAKSKPITVRGWVPQPDGSYRQLEELSEEERAEFRKKLAQRVGDACNRYYSAHPEEIAAFLACTS